MVSEHRKRKFDERLLSGTFSIASWGNGFVAIAAGFFAQVRVCMCMCMSVCLCVSVKVCSLREISPSGDVTTCAGMVHVRVYVSVCVCVYCLCVKVCSE